MALSKFLREVVPDCLICEGNPTKEKPHCHLVIRVVSCDKKRKGKTERNGKTATLGIQKHWNRLKNDGFPGDGEKKTCSFFVRAPQSSFADMRLFGKQAFRGDASAEEGGKEDKVFASRCPVSRKNGWVGQDRLVPSAHGVSKREKPSSHSYYNSLSKVRSNLIIGH